MSLPFRVGFIIYFTYSNRNNAQEAVIACYVFA